jgi:hypothetical protein
MALYRWGLYVLWLKYLANFWPEDAGFARTAIEDIELNDHRRTTARAYSPTSPSSPSSPTGQQRPHHVYGHGRAGLYALGHFSSPNQETVKILRSQLRELEMADDAGDVGSIRRRRRPRVSHSSQTPLTGHSRPFPLSGSDRLVGQQSGSSGSSAVNEARFSETEVTASSPRIDSHPMDAPHQRLRRDSISGEQQHSSTTSETLEEESNASGSSNRLGSSSTAVGDGQMSRPPEPQYYVGEVFRHKIYRYTGAIYGYDLSKCST